jgi:hypothetical protein
MWALDGKVNSLKEMAAKATILTSHTKVEFTHKIRILCPCSIPEFHPVYFLVDIKRTAPCYYNRGHDTLCPSNVASNITECPVSSVRMDNLITQL